MSAFFDTNILVYAQQMDGKGDQARALLAGGGKLSVQVLNEFHGRIAAQATERLA